MVFAFMMKSPFYERAKAGEEYGLYNGYVAFSEELPESQANSWLEEDEEVLDYHVCPHGGITFDREIKPTVSMIPLTEIPAPKMWENGIRCIGFDTAHLGDNAEKWNFESVKNETMEMYNKILQLIKERHG